MSDKVRLELEHCQAKDDAYLEICRAQEQRQQSSLARKRLDIERLARIESVRSQGAHNSASVFGLGYSGLGNGWTEAKPRILYPKERKRPRRHLREIYFSQDIIKRVSQIPEVLVPVRLDLDYDRFKLRDTFVWNISDDSVSFDIFAEHLCEDYGLPQVGFVTEIQKSLRGQLAEHHPHRFPDEQDHVVTEASHDIGELYTDTKDDDLRIIVKIDITIGVHNLVDQFEWDINNSQNDAERFAHNFCLEFGLVSEFVTAIAHAIREQSQMYTKTLFLVGHAFDGRAVLDSDVKQLIVPTIFTPLRPRHQMDRFAPALYELTAEQLEKVEREREREGRRNRRQTRGKRGAILPDLGDLPKTYCTPYMNTVLNSEGEGWVDNPGAVQANSTILNETDNVSDDDDQYIEGASPHFERSTRSSRSNRTNHMPNKSLHATLEDSSQFYFPNQQQEGYNTISGTYVNSYGNAVQIQNHPGTKIQSSQNLIRSTPAALLGVSSQLPGSAIPNETKLQRSTNISVTVPPSPTPSLIVKLKVPRLKQLLDQSPPFQKGQQVEPSGLDQSDPTNPALVQSSSGAALSGGSMQTCFEIPQHLQEHIQKLHNIFPQDSFETVIKNNNEQPQDGPIVRIRCHSCPGVLYFANDFEVHLRNRNHRSRVEQNLIDYSNLDPGQS